MWHNLNFLSLPIIYFSLISMRQLAIPLSCLISTAEFINIQRNINLPSISATEEFPPSKKLSSAFLVGWLNSSMSCSFVACFVLLFLVTISQFFAPSCRQLVFMPVHCARCVIACESPMSSSDKEEIIGH
jgi:hypothetical protein